MIEPNNAPAETLAPERAAGPRLRIALLGEGERITAISAALRAGPFELIGQAGMPQHAAIPDVAWSDDARVLLFNLELQAVVLAGSTRGDLELASLAVQRGLHVWRLPPAARSFAEADELLKHLPRETVYQVASWWEYAVAQGWSDLRWPERFQPQYSELHVSAAAPPRESWRHNLVEAGGGVLAGDAYALLESLVVTRGLPDSIYAAGRTFLRDIAKGARETEDTIAAILAYSGGGLALVRAGWDLPPASASLMHFAPGAIAEVTREELRLMDRDGVVSDRRPITPGWIAADLQRFAEHVHGRARDRAAATLERHLAVTALLETVYLSSQTGHPESPRKLYELHGRPLPRT